MTILRVGVCRTPDMALDEWAANKCYVDREPNYNVFIPRLIPGERQHSQFMTGASPDVRDVLKQTAVVYIADTGQYLEDLPANPTGLRVAFIHEVITGGRYATVQIRTGVDWEILVETQTYTTWGGIGAAHPPAVHQTSFRAVDELPAELDRSCVYFVRDQDNVNMHFTGSTSFEPSANLNKTNLFQQIREAEEAYSNIVRLDNIVQMDIVTQTLTRSSIMVIADASVTAPGGDSSVDAGMAMYLYDHNSGTTTKIYEFEGSDIVMTLSMITDAPATSEEFDALVNLSHEHAPSSQAVLDDATVNVDQNLVINAVALENGIDMHIQEW